MLTANKDLRKLLREATNKGWDFSVGKNHIKGRHADGARRITLSRTPSDRRALLNIRKDLGL